MLAHYSDEQGPERGPAKGKPGLHTPGPQGHGDTRKGQVKSTSLPWWDRTRSTAAHSGNKPAGPPLVRNSCGTKVPTTLNLPGSGLLRCQP